MTDRWTDGGGGGGGGGGGVAISPSRAFGAVGDNKAMGCRVRKIVNIIPLFIYYLLDGVTTALLTFHTSHLAQRKHTKLKYRAVHHYVRFTVQ